MTKDTECGLTKCNFPSPQGEREGWLVGIRATLARNMLVKETSLELGLSPYDTGRRRFAYALFSTSSTAARAATTAVRAARLGSGAAIAGACAGKIISQKTSMNRS